MNLSKSFFGLGLDFTDFYLDWAYFPNSYSEWALIFGIQHREGSKLFIFPKIIFIFPLSMIFMKDVEGS